MNQSERIESLYQAGYRISFVHDGFICMFKRDTDPNKNFILPEFHYVTVFPNGRVADGEHRKWTKIRKRNLAKVAADLIAENNEDGI